MIKDSINSNHCSLFVPPLENLPPCLTNDDVKLMSYGDKEYARQDILSIKKTISERKLSSKGLIVDSAGADKVTDKER